MAPRVRPALLLVLCSALLLGLATTFDFFCDDAFIVLRYARNLATLGAPVYNPFERVEGYTSLSWLLLATPGAALGLPLPRFVQAIGALCGVGLLAATWALFRRLRIGRDGFGALAMFAVALSAPIAAWTLGGLETPLFAALVTAAFALAIDVAEAPDAARGAKLGLVLGAASLTRPEGMLVSAAIGLPLLVLHARSRAGRTALYASLGIAGAIVIGHGLWRLHYYGYPLPNTFYLKSSGDGALLRSRGAGYVGLAARELAPWVPLCVAIGLLGPGRRGPGEPGALGRSLLTWIGRLLWPSYALYVVLVGGDFLDLYRFFVPLLPLSFVLAASAVAGRFGARLRGAPALALSVALVLLYGAHQHVLAARARQVREPVRASHGIEPLGWTREYALRWAAMGRWIARHAQPEDWMAVGAAGAMPYYAGLRNLDTFGLCDAWVAHHAPIVGNRPGHQRFAPQWYVLSKRPVFMLIGNDYTSETPRPLRREARWEEQGYTWAEAKVTVAEFGAPADYFHYFLMRNDRARERSASPWLRVPR